MVCAPVVCAPVVAVWVPPPAVCATRPSARFTASWSFVAERRELTSCVWALPPVVPESDGCWSCVVVLVAVGSEVSVGDAVALPVLLTSPPVALGLPDWLKLTVNAFNEVPPVMVASDRFWPEMLPPPVMATLPLPFALPPVPPRPSAAAFPLLPLLVDVALPEVLFAVGLAVLVLPVAAPPAPPVAPLPPLVAVPPPPLPPAPELAAPLSLVLLAAPEVASSDEAVGSSTSAQSPDRTAAMLAATLAALAALPLRPLLASPLSPPTPPVKAVSPLLDVASPPSPTVASVEARLLPLLI